MRSGRVAEPISQRDWRRYIWRCSSDFEWYELATVLSPSKTHAMARMPSAKVFDQDS